MTSDEFLFSADFLPAKPKSRSERMEEARLDAERMRPILQDAERMEKCDVDGKMVSKMVSSCHILHRLEMIGGNEWKC